MAGGGGKQTTTSEPWKASQPYLQDIFRQAQGLSRQPTEYFPGSTVVGALDSEQRAFDQLNAANAQTFGSGGTYEDASGALRSQLTGDTHLGNMASTFSPYATAGLIQGIQSGPSSVGRYGFSTALNPYALAPQFGKAGGLDATAALESALSGQPDYEGAQRAVDAANAPLLRNLEQNIIPSLNSRATFLNNGTGGIKALNNVLPELGERMATNAGAIMEGERQRALNAQQQAAHLVSQGGLQTYGMGLDAANIQAGLQQALAQQRLQTDTANASLRDTFRGDLLNFGSLAGQIGAQQGSQSLAALSQFPELTQAGQMPGLTGLQYGAWQRGLAEDALGADMDRWNFEQQEPLNRLNWYSQMVNGMAGLGGTTTAKGGGGSRAAGALGGALTGAKLGSLVPGLGTGVGAVMGGIAGLF